MTKNIKSMTKNIKSMTKNIKSMTKKWFKIDVKILYHK